MVALKDKCHHKDAKTRSYRRRDGESESPRPRVDRPTSECSVNSVAFHADQRNHNYVNEITQRAITGSSPVVFQYDGATGASNGNLKNDGTLIYAYDALNRPIQINRVSDGLVIATYLYDAMNRRVRKTILNGGMTGSVPNSTTDYIWSGSQVVEERNAGNTPIRQYIWGTYVDELIQLTTLVPLGPQSLPAGAYYLLQDLLYRAVALTNSSGAIVEAYDTDAYGNTLIFTGPGTDGIWFTDDDVQSEYGANETIFQGRQRDPESQLYYFRTRYYVPTLGRFVNRNPWGYIQGRYNLYNFAKDNPLAFFEPFSAAAAARVAAEALIALVIAIAAEQVARNAAKNTDFGTSCPPSPDPCPDLNEKLAKAAEKALKAAQSISEGYRDRYGGAGPRPGSGKWSEEMYKVTRDWSEYLASLQDMRDLNNEMNEAGC